MLLRTRLYSKNHNLFEARWMFSGGLLKKLPLSFAAYCTLQTSHTAVIYYSCENYVTVSTLWNVTEDSEEFGSQIWWWMEKTVTLYTAIDNQASFCFVLPLEKAVFDHDVSRLQWCVGVGSCADVEVACTFAEEGGKWVSHPKLNHKRKSRSVRSGAAHTLTQLRMQVN